MKHSWKQISRRTVSLLLSLVLALTLVTPAAFATEVVDGSGTTIAEGNTNPADPAPGEDSENNEDKNTEDGKDEQPSEPDDENAEPSEGEDAVNASSNEADTQEGEGTDTPVVAQRTVTVERYRTDAAYEVKIVVGVEEDGTTEKLDTTYTIDADTKTVTLKLTTDGYDGEPVYIKTALDDVLVTEGENQTPALTKDTPELEYALPEDGDVTLYYGTQEDFNAPATQRTATVEQYRANEAYDVKLVVGVEEDGTTEKLDTTYTINADTKTVTLKLTTADDAGEPIYIKTALDDVLVTEGENQTPALTKDTPTLEYTLPNEGDVTLYYGTQADFVSAWYGDGTATDYYIRTAEELAYFAQLVNGMATDSTGNTAAAQTFSGKVITLARDIDLSAVCHPADEESGIAEASWTPIGNYWDDASFCGVFDGNGKEIVNLYISSDEVSFIALFDNVVAGGMVKNLMVDGSIAAKNAVSVGGIAAFLYGGSITNCENRVTINLTTESKANNFHAGGIVGYVYGDKGGDEGIGSSTVDSCSNSGSIYVVATVSGCIGGIAGALGDADPNVAPDYFEGTIRLCQNSGEIRVTECKNNTWVGGIIGIGTGGSLTNCYNSGAVICTADNGGSSFVGGVIGSSGDFTNEGGNASDYAISISACENGGAVCATDTDAGYSSAWAGGIAGFSYGAISNAANTGRVQGQGMAGGIVGVNMPAAVSNCYNWGDVIDNGSDSIVSGIGFVTDDGENESFASNSYYICKINSDDTVDMKYINKAEQDITYEEAAHTYKVGEDTLVKTLNENRDSDGLSWFVNIPKGITKPIFVKLWDGTDIDTSWYVGHESDTEFSISTAAQLAGLAALVNGTATDTEGSQIAAVNFSGKTIKLTADIDLNSKEWTPIGNGTLKAGSAFSGTFDGDGHTIRGLNLNSSVPQACVGLFGVSNGTVENLTVEGSVSGSGKLCAVGAIAGRNSGGTVQNCLNKATVSAQGGPAMVIGGIVGINNLSGVAKNCWNEGTVTGTANAGVGGIVGGGGNAINCYNLGAVNAEGRGKAGGIVGSGTAQNCYYLCKVNNEDKSIYVDGTGAEKDIAKTGEGAATKYTVGESELVDLLNAWAKTNDAAAWENSTVEPYAPVFKAEGDTPEDKVTITYRANGGTGGITDTVDKDTEYTIRDDRGFSCKGKKLVGWNTSADGMGTSYEFGRKITVSESLTLYAVWENIWKGSGTESDPYQIENEADWLKMQKYAEKYEYYHGAWFALMNDITLDSSYEPFNFAGNLKGNHHAITVNIPKTTENGKHSRGLFDSLAGGTDGLLIENLTIAGSVTALQYAGGLAGSASSKVTLENVTSNVTVQAGGDQYDRTSAAGGLFGTYNGGRMYPLTVKNCTNSGTVTAYQAAGFVATMNSEANMSFSGCQNTGAITGKGADGEGFAAGFVSIYNAYNLTCTFENCANSGTISANARAAGIAINCRLAANCTNSGTINGNIAGGILESGAVKYSTNTGEINGKSCAAGIASAANTGAYTVEFCANFGKVTATAGSGAAKRAYGIASQGTVKNCFTYNNEAHVPVAGATGRNCIITNSYYLANSKDEFPSTMGGEWASEADFASGKVAWGVDGGTDKHENYWTQGSSGYPIPSGGDPSTSYYRAQATCGTGGTVTIKRGDGRTGDSDNAVYGPSGTTVTVTATPKDNTFGLKSLTWTHNGQTDVLPAKGTTNIVMPAESNGTIHAEFASVGPGGNGGYYYGGSGDGTGTGDKDDEGLQDGLNMDVEYDIKGLVLGAYAEWGSNGGNKSFQKWLEENPNVVRALLTNSLDNMATAAVGKKTDEAKDLAALLLASLNEHTGVDGKNGDTIAKALQKYIDSGSEEVFSAWLTGGGGMASGTYESIYGQYASSLAALADRLYSKWEASGTSMTFPVWLDSQQVTMESLSENAEEPDAEPDDTQTTEAPEDVPDGQDTEGGASGNSVWEVIGTVVRENPLIVWSIVAVIAAIVIVGAVRRYHKVKRDERDDNSAE